MKNPFFVICFLSLMSVPVWAGTYIQSISQSYKDKNDWYTDNVVIEQGKMRLDIQGPGLSKLLSSGKKTPDPTPSDTSMIIVFDQNTSLLDLVLPSKKAVYEITGADLAQIKGFLAAMAPELQKVIDDPKKMKKKDRAEYLKMKENLSEFLENPMVPEASGVSMNGYTCDKYAIRFQNKKLMDYWCLPATATPMDPQDHQTSKAMVGVFLDIAGGLLAGFGFDVEKIKSHPLLNSFTVCSISYDDKGKAKECYRLLSVKSQSFSPETFNIPATYEKTNVMDLAKSMVKTAAKGAPNGQAAPSNPTVPHD